MNVTLQTITETLIESFHATLDTVARERKYLALLEAPPLEQVKGFISGSLEKGNPHIVAVADQNVVGWCDIVRSGRPVESHLGYLGMGMLPEFRGRGIGTALLETAISDAQSKGLSRIELTVYTHNAPAIALYEKLGFVREGLSTDAVRIDGEFLDHIMMALVDRSVVTE